ncbi:50S ribosomal protein L6 [Candidatus Bathyarchaeota archaeon]|nr:50S ribosomal protein L6 [Candidatus Bathyarchaeota archaeon]
MSRLETRIVQIPEKVKVVLDGKVIKVTGEKGQLVRDFSQVPVAIRVDGDKIIVSALRSRRKESALVGTVVSHINNMIRGVAKGFTYKLKIVYSHFPMSVKVQGNYVTIENFIGERNPRKALILGNSSVSVKGDDIIVKGISIDDVSQTAANIEQATVVRRRDVRKFLDGIYIYEKAEGMVD